MPDGDQLPPTPTWLSPATLAAARAACGKSRMASQGNAESQAVREVIMAHHPALPLTMIAEAMAYVLREEQSNVNVARSRSN